MAVIGYDRDSGNEQQKSKRKSYTIFRATLALKKTDNWNFYSDSFLSEPDRISVLSRL